MVATGGRHTMGRRSLLAPILVFAVLLALIATSLSAASASPKRPVNVLRYRTAFEALKARQAEATRGTGTRAQPVLDDFTIVGHDDLGASDITGDVWVHEDTAYLGTWAESCNGLGVKVVDVSDPADPVMLGRVAGIPGTSAEDVVVRSVNTSSFTGDLLVTGIQRCDFEDASLDDDMFGVDIWNVSNPASPVHFTHFGINTGAGGVHELDLFQRGSNVYALLATPFSEWFDPSQNGDFWIVDLTDPANPEIVGEWGPVRRPCRRDRSTGRDRSEPVSVTAQGRAPMGWRPSSRTGISAWSRSTLATSRTLRSSRARRSRPMPTVMRTRSCRTRRAGPTSSCRTTRTSTRGRRVA
jgi:hypothetical protein